MKKIAIITGGNSSEYEISLQSAKVVKENLSKEKYKAIIVHVKEGKWEAIMEDKRLLMNKKDFSFQIGKEKISCDLAFMAFSQTCFINSFPLIFARGLPGNLWEFQRTGITRITVICFFSH